MIDRDPLPRGVPEAQGISSKAILGFLRELDSKLNSLHGLMLQRHGVIVAECAWRPYRLELPHKLFSLSKSFASTAIGLAVDEGRLSVDDQVLSFFPDKAPRVISPNLSAMKVLHLLSMNTGHETDTVRRFYYSRDPVKVILSLPVEHEPGSHFAYNQAATFLLSAIIQKLTGQRLSAYLEPRLFAKLGIRGATWDRQRSGIDLGFIGLHLAVEDIVRFGQLYLQKGMWKAERILPEAWVATASAKHSETARADMPDPESEWQQGYGYQFWRCRHGAYRGDGAMGQLCVVMPREDVVLATVSGFRTSDIHTFLDLAWKWLLPAMSDSALASDPAALELRDHSSRFKLRIGARVRSGRLWKRRVPSDKG